MMIASFHPEVAVLSSRKGAPASEIQFFRQRFPDLPPAFAELYREVTEIELSYKGRYLRLYGPSGSLEFDEAYQISEAIPGSVVVGDNGGGEAIIFISKPKAGLYRVSYGALALEEAVYIASSIESLLCRAEPASDRIGGVQAQQSAQPDRREDAAPG
jgi:hypothetical protein